MFSWQLLVHGGSLVFLKKFVIIENCLPITYNKRFLRILLIILIENFLKN